MSIRLAKEQDLPEILNIYAPYVLATTYSFEYTVPSLEEFTERFKTITAFFPWLVWEENGKILGYAYGSFPFTRAAYQWSAEVSIYISSENRGKGIGRKLYETLERILISQGFHKIYAIITDENADSIAFHKSLGYKEVAHLPDCGYKFGRLCGTIWMEKSGLLCTLPSNKPTSCRNIVNNNSFQL